MDIISYLSLALLAFLDNYPDLARVILLIYVWVALLLFIILCGSLLVRDSSMLFWLPTIFLTDGILVWFSPLAAVLSILFWPLLPVRSVLLDCFRLPLTAPTFCGIKREAFVRLYAACADRLQRWKRDWRDKEQRRDRLLGYRSTGSRTQVLVPAHPVCQAAAALRRLSHTSTR
ncbi:hypothetical protein FJTKL_02335 [Diaporthe vaccinii]|uniref:Uncharacterized protein n=1 Tax=Diaporthe vaccinii TaxID=105482 RepID=A0ABR4F3S9_9PEZI